MRLGTTLIAAQPAVAAAALAVAAAAFAQPAVTRSVLSPAAATERAVASGAAAAASLCTHHMGHATGQWLSRVRARRRIGKRYKPWTHCVQSPYKW